MSATHTREEGFPLSEGLPLPEGKVRALVDELKERCSPVAVYLFGSRAAGEERSDSDLDLAVLLPEGVRIPLLEKMSIVERLAGIVGFEVDLVVLNEARLPIQFEIIRNGRLLYEQSFDERTDAEDRIVRDYLDFKPFLERSAEDIFTLVRENTDGHEGGDE